MAQADSNSSMTAPDASTRRGFLSQAAGVGGTVLALGNVPPASALGLPASPADAALTAAYRLIVEIDEKVRAIIAGLGVHDDPEDHPGYPTLEAARFDAVDLLIDTPADSLGGMIAKASALKLRTIADDPESSAGIGKSLAGDVLAGVGNGTGLAVAS